MGRALLKPPPARPGRSSRGAQWIAPLLAAVLAAAVYGNSLHNPFVYDDHDTVTANPSLADPTNVRFLLVYSPFRPVVNLSYAADRVLWGAEPFGFHVTSVALHAGAVVLFYVLLVNLLSDAGLARWRRAAAFTGASMFALHPLQTEAVGYVSGRSELMCAVWFLAALLAARRALISGSFRPAAAAFACAAMALASKEVAVVLPVLVLAYGWLLRSGADAPRRSKLVQVFGLACTLLLLVGIARLLALGPGAIASGARPLLLNLLTQSIVVWRYAGLLLWPQGQSIMHSVHRVTSVIDPLALTAVAALALVCAAAWRARRSHPLLAFGAIWFLAVLAPSSSFIALREGMAEHRVYLASAGIFLGVAELSARWLERRPAAVHRLPRRFAVTVCLLLATLGALTLKRNMVWGSPISLWAEATVQAAGMWEPQYALGDSLREAGDCARAVASYEAVVQLRPSHRDAYTNLGICQAQLGRVDEAEHSFRRALEIDPGFVRGYTNLGALALVRGDAEGARDFYAQALAHDSANLLARLQLASLFEHTFKDYHSAARMCGEARLLAPSTPGVVECVERNQHLAAARDAGR